MNYLVGYRNSNHAQNQQQQSTIEEDSTSNNVATHRCSLCTRTSKWIIWWDIATAIMHKTNNNNQPSKRTALATTSRHIAVHFQESKSVWPDAFCFGTSIIPVTHSRTRTLNSYPQPSHNYAYFPKSVWPDAFRFCTPTIPVPGHPIHILNPPTTMHLFPKACDQTLFTLARQSFQSPDI
jgi:hypothetical protein